MNHPFGIFAWRCFSRRLHNHTIQETDSCRTSRIRQILYLGMIHHVIVQSFLHVAFSGLAVQHDCVSVLTDSIQQPNYQNNRRDMAKRRLSAEYPIHCDPCHSKMLKTTHLSPSQITAPSKRTHVEGVVRSVSPGVKKNYFDGELSDGAAVVRLVGFEEKQLKKLIQFCAEQQPCLLRSCDISTGKNRKPEVIVKSYTKVEKSPTNFSIPDPENDGATPVSLINLDQLDDNERVTVKVVVVKMKEIETVSNGKRK